MSIYTKLQTKAIQTLFLLTLKSVAEFYCDLWRS